MDTYLEQHHTVQTLITQFVEAIGWQLDKYTQTSVTNISVPDLRSYPREAFALLECVIEIVSLVMCVILMHFPTLMVSIGESY